ncbi:GPI anchored serine-threonine rich family protein, partial [Escherichia coli]|nr:GPI anchored serine-threonine rich family protein [Escherichia coli]
MNAKWDLSQTHTIKWDHVDSDPETFQLVLVNHQTGGEVDMTIADKVKTSDGEYELADFVAAPGAPYIRKAVGTEKT